MRAAVQNIFRAQVPPVPHQAEFPYSPGKRARVRGGWPPQHLLPELRAPCLLAEARSGCTLRKWGSRETVGEGLPHCPGLSVALLWPPDYLHHRKEPSCQSLSQALWPPSGSFVAAHRPHLQTPTLRWGSPLSRNTRSCLWSTGTIFSPSFDRARSPSRSPGSWQILLPITLWHSPCPLPLQSQSYPPLTVSPSFLPL